MSALAQASCQLTRRQRRRSRAAVRRPKYRTKYSYDTRGNLTSDGSRTFTYDVENRLVTEVGGAGLTLSYDPFGRLTQTISGATTTQFLYDGDRLVAEYNGATSTVLRRYVHGPGTDEPIVWYEGSTLTTRNWLHADERGSVIATTDGAATATLYTYGDYGEPNSWTGSRFKYTGQIALPEAQLYHYKARVYDPGIGRFLQTDPVGYKDDLDLYAYVGGDPTNAVDPTGLACNLLNSGSAYCQRATLYGDIDGRVSAQTRFFAAASATVQSLASLDMPGASSLVSSQTRDFMRTLSARLEVMNRSIAGEISSGRLSGSGLDAKIVHREQTAVQTELDSLKSRDKGAFGNIVSEVNSLLNPKGAIDTAASSFFGTDKAYGRVLDQVRKDLGRDIDFSRQGDREAIGNSVIDHVRKSGGCDVTGSRIKSC